MPRIHLGLLRALASDWRRLLPLLSDESQVAVLDHLEAVLQPRLRHPVEPAQSLRTLQRVLAELNESLARFNERWGRFLESVDLTQVNKLREGYNRYYLLEKECAVRSYRIALQGFQRLEPLTVSDLETLLPPLPVPHIK